MIPLKRVNRIAGVAILPLMALAIVIGTRSIDRASAPKVPREGLLVVAQLRGEAITTFNLEVRDTPLTRSLSLPGPAHEFVYTGGRLYLTLSRANLLAEMEVSVPAILRTIAIDGEPNGIAVTGDQLLVTLDKGNALVALDRASLTESGRTTTGSTPHNVAVADGIAYVTDTRDNVLRAIATPVATTPTGALPESVATVGGFVVTADADGGTITIVRRAGFQSVGSLPVGGRPVRVIALDDRRVAVALNAQAEVAIVDVVSRRVEQRLKTLGHPDGMCLSPSGSYLAVVSNEAGAVQAFQRSGWRLAATYEVGGGPGACIWLALN